MEKECVIRLINLSKCFKENIYTLDCVNLEIHKGEIFGIIGKSGAGKSTLLRCLLGLELPTKGQVLLEGEDISLLSQKNISKRRMSLGMIFQNCNLLHARSVFGNVSFPLEIAKIPEKERKKRVRELLDLVGLQGKENDYPATLSGGEKQRVAIARALANQPKILFCDEPTSALDPNNVKAILHLLKTLQKKLALTVVLITHQMEVIREICTQVAVLDQGKLIEQSRVADLFAHPKHAITRRFLQRLSHDLPAQLLQGHPKKELLRLSFRGEKAKKPIITELVRRAHIDVNILGGSIDTLQEEIVGHLIVEVAGEKSARKLAREFLEKEKIIYEVI